MATKSVMLSELFKSFSQLKNDFNRQLNELNSSLDKFQKTKSEDIYFQKNQNSRFLRTLQVSDFEAIDSLQYTQLLDTFNQNQKIIQEYSTRIAELDEKESDLGKLIFSIRTDLEQKKSALRKNTDFGTDITVDSFSEILSLYQDDSFFVEAKNSSFFQRFFNSELKSAYTLLKLIEKKTGTDSIEFIKKYRESLAEIEQIKLTLEEPNKDLDSIRLSKKELEKLKGKGKYIDFYAFLLDHFYIDHIAESDLDTIFSNYNATYFSSDFFEQKFKALDTLIDDIKEKIKIVKKQYESITDAYYKLNKVPTRNLSKTVNFDMSSLESIRQLNSTLDRVNHNYQENYRKLNSNDFNNYSRNNRHNDDWFNLMLIYLSFNSINAHSDPVNISQLGTEDSQLLNSNIDLPIMTDAFKDINSSLSNVDTYYQEETTRSSYSNNDGGNYGGSYGGSSSSSSDSSSCGSSCGGGGD